MPITVTEIVTPTDVKLLTPQEIELKYIYCSVEHVQRYSVSSKSPDKCFTVTVNVDAIGASSKHDCATRRGTVEIFFDGNRILHGKYNDYLWEGNVAKAAYSKLYEHVTGKAPPKRGYQTWLVLDYLVKHSPCFANEVRKMLAARTGVNLALNRQAFASHFAHGNKYWTINSPRSPERHSRMCITPMGMRKYAELLGVFGGGEDDKI